MPLRIGDEQTVAQQRQAHRPFQSIGDGKLDFAFLVEGNHAAQVGVGDKQCSAVFHRGHRRLQAKVADDRPALPLFAGQIQIIDRGRAGVGHHEVLRVVQRQAERPVQFLAAAGAARDPVGESHKRRRPHADVARLGNFPDKNDAGAAGGGGQAGGALVSATLAGKEKAARTQSTKPVQPSHPPQPGSGSRA